MTHASQDQICWPLAPNGVDPIYQGKLHCSNVNTLSLGMLILGNFKVQCRVFVQGKFSIDPREFGIAKQSSFDFKPSSDVLSRLIRGAPLSSGSSSSATAALCTAPQVLMSAQAGTT